MVDESHVVEDEEDIFDPRSTAFCRACVDMSAYGLSKPVLSKQISKDEPECPPDKGDLGRASWTLLHTMGAYYPIKPTIKQQNDMTTFIKNFANFYPCVQCAVDFRGTIAYNPPKVDSRFALSGWLCIQHNYVNKKIGKPLFDCTYVLDRWRYGWKNSEKCKMSYEDERV